MSCWAERVFFLPESWRASLSWAPSHRSPPRFWQQSDSKTIIYSKSELGRWSREGPKYALENRALGSMCSHRYTSWKLLMSNYQKLIQLPSHGHCGVSLYVLPPWQPQWGYGGWPHRMKPKYTCMSSSSAFKKYIKIYITLVEKSSGRQSIRKLNLQELCFCTYFGALRAEHKKGLLLRKL